MTPDYKLLFTIQMRECNLFLPGINPEWVCWVEKCERERWTDRERWREEKRDNGMLVSMYVCVCASTCECVVHVRAGNCVSVCVCVRA